MGRIESFLSNYPNKGTRRNYTEAITRFLELTCPGNEPSERKADFYFAEPRDTAKDVERLVASMQHGPPMSIRATLSAVRGFLVENGVELRELDWRKVKRRIRGSRPLTLDRVPTVEDMKAVLAHLPLQSQAVMLFSPMRI